jgi:glutamate synthase (NADPH) large chain
MTFGHPEKQGLYDPANEHDACGVGFVADLKGRKSHQILRRALDVLINLTHRGATGADPETGDGAGVLLQLPDDFFRQEAAALEFALPPVGQYGVAMVFLARDVVQQNWEIQVLEKAVEECGQGVLGWRDVPIDITKIGPIARGGMPIVRQLFVSAAQGLSQDDFEERLYLARRLAEKRVGSRKRQFHIPSFSSRTIVYKGLLLAHQIEGFYADLSEESVKTALALVHQRYSTNTFPTWDLAQPFRYMAHNGEINTLRGNINWMHARERSLHNQRLGDDLPKLLPLLTPGASDSAIFDNAFEFLVQSGRGLSQGMMMMIPQAWDNEPHMDPALRAFYQFHSHLLEPWDGPACIAFTDGRKIGAILDRNGLRPARYMLTKDGVLVLASEAGVLEVSAEEVERKGQLQPGRIFLVDTENGHVVEDEQIKKTVASQHPYEQWVERRLLRLKDLAPLDELASAAAQPMDAIQLKKLQRVFGYTLEDLSKVLPPMASQAKGAMGSMGNDAALACLSDGSRLLYHYFKQVFAQVTNPPIDPIRERLVMSLVSTLGRLGNLGETAPSSDALLHLERPLIDEKELKQIQASTCLKTRQLSTLYRVSEGAEGLRSALEDLCLGAEAAVNAGTEILVLTDRAVNRQLAAIPALLALSAVHQHLVKTETRTQCGLIVDTGEAREAGHFALLLGYGASAICPHLALETLREIVDDATYVPEGLRYKTAVDNYFTAIDKELLKIFAKMGISTLQSYQGAQLFEAIGLSGELVNNYFSGTPSRVSGIGLEVIAEETKLRHQQGFDPVPPQSHELEAGGLYHWRRQGERHAFSPQAIAKLQHAVQRGCFKTYQEFSQIIGGAENCTLRGLFQFRFVEVPLSLDEIEPASEIVKRFCTGAMSYGSISREAHENLAIAMNRLGGKSNTGEGGEDAERFSPDADGESRRSAIKQVASGRFGVTSWYLVNADEIQIKMAQGAKPGEGGQLPGYKVDEVISRLRHSTPGVGLISPPPHHDIYSIEDLAQLIHDLKNANNRARISVKLVAETGVGTVAAGVAKGKADTVLISGHDGGTGASPLTSIKYAGSPWEIGLAETQQTLVLNDLRGRIRVQVDGGLKTGRDVVIGALLGAEEFGFSTAPLVTQGCIMMRACHLNTCPVGIATQNKALRKKFQGNADHLVKYFMFVAEEVRLLMARLGFRHLDEMVGQVDRLDVRPAIDHWKARGLDFSKILYRPQVAHAVSWYQRQDHGLAGALDNTLIQECKSALERGESVAIRSPIRNINRSVGVMLGAEVSRQHGADGLPDDTIRLTFDGVAGQSLAAFLPRGISITVEGEANDYVGKGLSGGKVVVRVAKGTTFDPAQNIIVGNVVLYGATSGEAYFGGRAGERFCVRNSGANAVVEGIGDHGCEYMTGGRVLILGSVGRNFAAGMSGGIAYVFDEQQKLADCCNMEMVELETLDADGGTDDEETVIGLLRRHVLHTESQQAGRLLAEFDAHKASIVKVMPREYKRVLQGRKEARCANG